MSWNVCAGFVLELRLACCQLRVRRAHHQHFSSDGPRDVARQSLGWSPVLSTVSRVMFRHHVVYVHML